MQVLKYCDAYNVKIRDILHFLVLLSDSTNYYIATSKFRPTTGQEAKVSDLADMEMIPTLHMWPEYSPEYTSVPEFRTADLYLKTPDLLSYDPQYPQDFPNQILEELKILEMLKRNPHPNIGTYHGCKVIDGQIRGIWLTKYPMELQDRVKDQTRPLNVEKLLQGIQDGIKHIHSLGLIHNDINPANIMITDDDTPVIIDFDSCRRKGEELGLKAGTFPWVIDDYESNDEENDWYCFRQIKLAFERRKPGEELIAPEDDV